VLPPPPQNASLTQFQPSSPVAKFIFVHGYDDHIGRYYELFPTLASRNISVVAWDQRGWGKSAKTKSQWGLTGPTSQVIADIAHVIEAQLPSAVPIFVMGHSMGGGEVLTLASMPEYEKLMPSIRGFMLNGPHIALPYEPPFLKVWVGKIAAKLLPHFPIVTKLAADTITRDPEVMKSMEEDPLLRATGTLEGMAGLLERAQNLHTGKAHLNKGVQALWVAHGTIDSAVSYPASKAWFDREAKTVPDAEFKSYEGWQHALHADLPDTRPIFAKDVGDWILARAGGEVVPTVVQAEEVAVAPQVAEETSVETKTSKL
jgi:acylglycerol lipase